MQELERQLAESEEQLQQAESELQRAEAELMQKETEREVGAVVERLLKRPGGFLDCSIALPSSENSPDSSSKSM